MKKLLYLATVLLALSGLAMAVVVWSPMTDEPETVEGIEQDHGQQPAPSLSRRGPAPRSIAHKQSKLSDLHKVIRPESN